MFTASSAESKDAATLQNTISEDAELQLDGPALSKKGGTKHDQKDMHRMGKLQQLRVGTDEHPFTFKVNC